MSNFKIQSPLTPFLTSINKRETWVERKYRTSLVSCNLKD